MTEIANQIMPAISKSTSLKKLYLGQNPWSGKDLTDILNTYTKPAELMILDLGIHTYLTAECVNVLFKLK